MKNFIKNFEDSMAAVAFAESGDEKTARQIISEMRMTKKEGRSLNVKDERVESLIKKHERTEEAIVFAEAGEYEYAREILKRDDNEKKKILVVGAEEGFSEKLVHYALGMAERMDYEIVALNVIPAGNRLFSLLNEKVREELRERTVREADTFRKKAEDKDILFSHNVRFGDFDKSIKDAHKDFKRISFVLTEPEHVADRSPAKAGIPVFCLDI
ncbi:MAG: universal stress protein [Nitrospirota bacterium]|nr:universal stress protein [Nitrospirota bacterium]